MGEDGADDEMMLFYRKEMKVKDVEAIAKRNMGDHDNLPRVLRDADNEYVVETRVPKWVYVRSKGIADKYIRADGSKPAVAVTDEEKVLELAAKVSAAFEKWLTAGEEYREVNLQYKRLVAKVRWPLLLGFASRCLGHAECCGLRETQVEWLRELERRTVEVKDRDLEWRDPNKFTKDEMDRVIRIWLKIKYGHEIEDATTGIEWEIEQEVAKREEREARERAWRMERAAKDRAERAARLPVRWQTPELVEIPPASILPKPEPTTPFVVRRR
jgi:hypothetical protein